MTSHREVVWKSDKWEPILQIIREAGRQNWVCRSERKPSPIYTSFIVKTEKLELNLAYAGKLRG